MNRIMAGWLSGIMLSVASLQPIHAEEPQYAIATQSVINLRLTPAHEGEMGTQALMGMPLRVVSVNPEGWVELKTPEGYTSWATASSVRLINEQELKAWNKSQKLIITDYFTVVRKSSVADANVVSDVVMGDLLKRIGSSKGFFKVELPDGTTGYVKKESARPFDKWLASRRPTGNNIVATARQFMGFPYLWGGISSKGLDCSGFTKTCYFLNGVILLRDASQQAKTGEPVDISKGYDNLQLGDLLFFGARKEGVAKVTHVGIYIGNGEFIHSSGTVHVGSLQRESPLYDAWNANRLLCARRMLTQIDKDPQVVSILKNPLYQ